MTVSLDNAFPELGRHLRRVAIADLPTPVSEHALASASGTVDVYIKHDDASSMHYGGNKVRKLEYLLQRAIDKNAQRVATFGAAGSNHALATAIHAKALNLECTCFLSHQEKTPAIARTLNMHRLLGTEIVRWGGSIDSLSLYRQHLQHRDAWVIPLGGTSWLGCVGFVNAGLELADQVRRDVLPAPARIYIACGTTGSAAGLAIGLMAAGLDTTVQAIQVADNPFSSHQKMLRLMSKTGSILRRLDPMFGPDDDQYRITWRDEFLAGGYARVDEATRDAVELARQEFGISLETTYTGKAMAAMLHDLETENHGGETWLFWNTYNSRPLPVTGKRPEALDNIPAEFARYYDL